MPTDEKQELLTLSQKLLTAISKGDWSAYAKLCDASLTAFEPEALGHLVEGLAFHEFYFKLPGDKSSSVSTICDPHIRILGDTALVCYYRLTQVATAEGKATTRGTQETRVWQRMDGKWKHIHFHRSPSETA